MSNNTPNIMRVAGTTQPIYLRGVHRSVYLAAYQRQAAIVHLSSIDGELLAA